MSHTQEASQGAPGDARSIDKYQIADPHGEDEIQATDDRARRWYHLRPQPRRGTDLMGFNSTWWMAVAWLIVIVVLVEPWWW
jgi:hypothetical protein